MTERDALRLPAATQSALVNRKETTMSNTTKKRRAIPPRNKHKNDLVMTDSATAKQIVQHFQPDGLCLDSCAGEGAFVQALLSSNAERVWACEKNSRASYYTGTSFYEWTYPVRWIISNPPYSHFLAFLKHSFTAAENVVYLIQPPSAFFTAKLNAAECAGFGIKEIYRVDCPAEWTARGLSFGAGLGAVHWQKGYCGPIALTDGRVSNTKAGVASAR